MKISIRSQRLFPEYVDTYQTDLQNIVHADSQDSTFFYGTSLSNVHTYENQLRIERPAPSGLSRFPM